MNFKPIFVQQMSIRYDEHFLILNKEIKFLFFAGREAIMSQFRVWPFLSTLIMTFGERNRNPGHHFA
jgi:hypothetical protein